MPVFVTDASGFEGFGGWTVKGDHLVFCAALWPEPVLTALRNGKFSVSAAELFTQAAVATAIGGTGQCGVFIGDFSAACNAVAKGSSSTPQMREMLNILLAVAPGTTWLSVHVRREHNTVADDLSKLKLGEVVRFALTKQGPRPRGAAGPLLGRQGPARPPPRRGSLARAPPPPPPTPTHQLTLRQPPDSVVGSEGRRRDRPVVG